MFRSLILSTREVEQWTSILNRCKLRDPCYLPQYLTIYERLDNKESFSSFGGEGFLFVYGDSENFIIYPFFKRKIADLPFAKGSLRDMYDIISPYGYGGPIPQFKDETLYEDLCRGFYLSFSTFCKNNNIISEFCRLHPIFENHVLVKAFSDGIVQKIGKIVYIDLSCSEEELLNNMEHSHRRKIRKAVSNPDLSFEVVTQNGPDGLFYKNYVENMQMVGVENKYLFSPGFFVDAFRNLSEFISLNQISYKGNCCAQWIVLKNGDYAYSWLSASQNEYLYLSPNNLMVYDLCLKLKKEGINHFNLGGGRGAQEDSVYQFKKGFSKLSKDFYIYKKIHLNEAYTELVKLKANETGNSDEYFPKYRLEVEKQSHSIPGPLKES
jgi:Acetyltransferase (GNAT) domain